MRATFLSAFTLMLLPCAAAFAATVYKWVDEKGVTHYSDQPQPGAQKIEVSSAQTYASTPAPPATPATLPQTPPAPAYQACAVSRPANDEVLMNVTSITGAARLQPQLIAGHKISVMLDGQPVAGAGNTGEFTISPIARGTHTLTISVQDAGGQEVCRSAAVTFHVRQPSALAPNPANRPRF